MRFVYESRAFYSLDLDIFEPNLIYILVSNKDNIHRIMVRLQEISVSVQQKVILDKVTIGFEEGQRWIITGDNGAGKTTLARTIAGRMAYHSGYLEYDHFGEDDPFSKISMITFTETGYLFSGAKASHYYQQRYNSWDFDGHLTVQEYLEDGKHTIGQSAYDQLITDLGLEPLLLLERIKLSSGQHRKMFIAKALLQDPKILLLDNLFVGLDVEMKKWISGFIDRLSPERVKLILIFDQSTILPESVSHEMRLANGKVAYLGPKRLGKSPKVVNRPDALESISRIFSESLMLPASDVVVDLVKVNVSYSGRQLIKNLSWTIRRGEKWLLTGSNGSGKSLILSLIYGDNPQAHANQIELFGRSIGAGRSIWEIKSHIGFSSPELHMYLRHDLNFTDVIISGLTDSLYPRVDGTEIPVLGVTLIDFYNVEGLCDQSFSSLSTGEQSLCLFIRSLIKNPPLLLLDEPFQGMDARTIEKSKMLLQECLSDNHTVILISHDLSEVPENGFRTKKI